MIDESRLQNVKHKEGGIITSACPACREQGHDKTGNHLSVFANGKFGCVQFPKDQGVEHRKRIFELVGIKDQPTEKKPNRPRVFATLEDAIRFQMSELKMFVTRRDTYNKDFVVVRFDKLNNPKDKEFRPFHRNSSAGWIVKDPPGKLPLFNLPELLARPNELLFVPEGEKCVCALSELGLLAITSAHGAKSADKTDWQPLAGREVVILPDNDAEGRGYAQTVAGILNQLSPSAVVKIVELPDLPMAGDCVDWLANGGDAEALIALADNAPEWTPPETEKSWIQALNEAVVTSSQLRDLQLTPRRKLLGDWFCEGDLGFIFAFRGVGKTWLALAIAQALSTAGQLGDWKAPEKVKVLYIDGEMPPDLMRDRCNGLEGSNDNLEFLNHEILFERTGKVVNITRPEVQQAIAQRCVETKVKVLILDNLSTVATGMKENEADAWELVNNWLLDLRRRKIAVVIVHHAGRSGEMRGTSKREDNVFWILALDDAKETADDKRGARFVSRFTKSSRNTQEEIAAYEWHFITEPNGEVSISHKLAQTLDVFLGLVGDGVGDCATIAEQMRISKASVSRMAKKAEEGGKIIIKSREYFLKEGAKNDPKS